MCRKPIFQRPGLRNSLSISNVVICLIDLRAWFFVQVRVSNPDDEALIWRLVRPHHHHFSPHPLTSLRSKRKNKLILLRFESTFRKCT